MIPVNELRLFNLVNYRGKFAQIISIDETDIGVRVIKDKTEAYVPIGSVHIAPVKISTELLTKLGFKPFNWENLNFMDHFTDAEEKMFLRFVVEREIPFQVEPTVNMFTSSDFEGIMNFIAEVPYYHQFQNVLFDIYQEEAPIPSEDSPASGSS